MDTELLWLLLFIISILVMVGSGKSRKDGAYIALSTLLIFVTGTGLFVGYPLVYATNSLFIIFVGVMSLYGIVKTFNSIF